MPATAPLTVELTLLAGQAVLVATALGFVGLVNQDRVVIELFNDRLTQSMPPARGRRSLWRMFDHLEGVQPAESVPLAQGVKNFCLRNSGKGVVVLITDLLEKGGYQDALRFLCAQQRLLHPLDAQAQAS